MKNISPISGLTTLHTNTIHWIVRAKFPTSTNFAVQNHNPSTESLIRRNGNLGAIKSTHYVYIRRSCVPPGPNQSSSTRRLTNPFACVAISNSDSGSRPGLRTRPMKILCYGYVLGCVVVVVCMLIWALKLCWSPFEAWKSGRFEICRCCVFLGEVARWECAINFAWVYWVFVMNWSGIVMVIIVGSWIFIVGCLLCASEFVFGRFFRVLK